MTSQQVADNELKVWRDEKAQANLDAEEARRLEKVLPLEGKQLRSLTEAQMVCPGYGGSCGREKDFDAVFCERCTESVELDERAEKNLAYWRAENLRRVATSQYSDGDMD